MLYLIFVSIYISIRPGRLVVEFLCNLENSQPVTKAGLATFAHVRSVLKTVEFDHGITTCYILQVRTAIQYELGTWVICVHSNALHRDSVIMFLLLCNQISVERLVKIKISENRKSSSSTYKISSLWRSSQIQLDAFIFVAKLLFLLFIKVVVKVIIDFFRHG
jgi:hypothetical protein